MIDTNNSEPEIEKVPFEILRQSAAGQRESTAVSKCAFNLTIIDTSGQDVSAEQLSGIERVISSQEDFEHYLTCDDDDAGEINLDTIFILAGMTTPQFNGVQINDQRVIVTRDTLRYNVEIWDKLITVPEQVISLKFRMPTMIIRLILISKGECGMKFQNFLLFRNFHNGIYGRFGLVITIKKQRVICPAGNIVIVFPGHLIVHSP